MTRLFRFLPDVGENFARSAQPNVVACEENRAEARQCVLNNEWAEEMELVVHDVRRILAEVVLHDAALYAAAVTKC